MGDCTGSLFLSVGLNLIEHLTANGTIDPAILYDRPYTDVHHGGLSGLFSAKQVSELVELVQDVNLVVESSGT